MTRSPRISPSAQAGQIDQIMTSLAQRLSTVSGGAAVAAIAQAGTYHVGGARWASVSVLNQGRFRTLVATAPMAAEADALQHQLGQGPTVDPTLGGTVHLMEALARDRRWPDFGTRAHHDLGVVGLVAYRLPLPGDPGTTVVLSLYSDAVEAFDGPGLWTGALLAAQAVQAVSAGLHHQPAKRQEQERPRAQELAAAQQIGAAIGVLMVRYGATRDEALGMLRSAARDSGRDLAGVAGEVIDTETLRLPPMPAGPYSPCTPGRPKPTGGSR